MFCFSISTNEFFKLIFEKTLVYLAAARYVYDSGMAHDGKPPESHCRL